MITDTEALSQIERVLGLPYAPVPDKSSVDDTAIAELCTALIGSTRSLAHAKATIDELMRGERCPTPRDIYRTANELAPAERGSSCSQCRGLGWIYSPFVKDGIKIEASRRCSCNGGGKEPEKPRDSKMHAAADCIPEGVEW